MSIDDGLGKGIGFSRAVRRCKLITALAAEVTYFSPEFFRHRNDGSEPVSPQSPRAPFIIECNQREEWRYRLGVRT